MSNFVLKLIALVCMIIDHYGATFGNIILMRGIGRIAFPIYAFLIAEGCAKTRDLKKYVLRLLLFAFISEIPFDLLLYNTFFTPDKNAILLNGFVILTPAYQNVFFTLALGALSTYFYKVFIETRKSIMIVGLFGVLFATLFIKSDYDIIGVLLILILYSIPQKIGKVIVILIFSLNTCLGQPWPIYLVLLAPLFIFLYNGKRGPNNAFIRWGFYVAYPLHLLIIFFLWRFR